MMIDFLKSVNFFRINNWIDGWVQWAHIHGVYIGGRSILSWLDFLWSGLSLVDHIRAAPSQPLQTFTITCIFICLKFQKLITSVFILHRSYNKNLKITCFVNVSLYSFATTLYYTLYTFTINAWIPLSPPHLPPVLPHIDIREARGVSGWRSIKFLVAEAPPLESEDLLYMWSCNCKICKKTTTCVCWY